MKDSENQACIFELAKVRIVSKQSFGGITPLMTAAKSNNVDCVAYLLSIGAKNDAVDNCGRQARLRPLRSGRHLWPSSE